MGLDFTGEQFIPGKTSQRIADDHISRYKFALQFVDKKTVLDVACGSGFGSKMLRAGGALLVDGADISSDLIDYAKNHFQTEGVNFFVDDIVNSNISKRYDVITSFETIEHIHDYKKALRTFYLLLNKPGILLISSPNRIITAPTSKLQKRPSNPHHVQEFTIDELRRELTECGFFVSDNDIYGHRQQRYFKNRYIRRLYKYIFRPDIKYDPTITRLHAHPRCFLIIAHKI